MIIVSKKEAHNIVFNHGKSHLKSSRSEETSEETSEEKSKKNTQMEKQLKPLQRRKDINKIIIFFTFILIISCKKQSSEEKDLFYYRINYDSKATGYKIRKYEFSNDTIFEKEVLYNSKGKLSVGEKIFLKKSGNFFLIESNGQEKEIRPFLTTKIDSCNYIKHPYANYEICYQGKTNYLSFKDVHKYEYSQDAIDGVVMDVYVNSNFIILGTESSNALFTSELLTSGKDVPKEIFKKLNKKISSVSD